MAAPSKKARILVVDDEERLRSVLQRVLGGRFEIRTAHSGNAAKEVLQRERFDLILTDLMMEDGDGFDVLGHLARMRAPPPVIVLTAYGSIESAVRATKEGAREYITKPFDNQKLIAAIDAVLAKPTPAEPPSTTELVGSKDWLDRLNERLERFADSSSTVLLRGETGTGKSAIARRIHELSRRASGPFVEMNCANFGDNLVEAQLFGTVEGAYTGAVNMPGKLEAAAGGTLFLDEIGELKPDTQSRLLLVLEKRPFARMGSNTLISPDFRLICATNRDLEEDVIAKKFRQDLFYRIRVGELVVPPLRDRPADIPILVDHLHRKVAQSLEFKPHPISPELMAVFTRYHWPGNIRELANAVEASCMLAGRHASAGLEHLPEYLKRAIMPGAPEPAISEPPRPASPSFSATSAPGCPPGVPLSDWLNMLERNQIVEMLQSAKGNRSEAARRLGMRRTTLIEKIRKHKISDDDGGTSDGGED